MINPKILLKEKQRYKLPLVIDAKEMELLKLDTPIQKIIGYIIMQDVTIFLQEKVLIPRYETEEVILETLKYIKPNSKVLDLCCGSGFIGLAIAKQTNANVTLSDIDPNAIKQSKYNATFNNLNVKIIQSDLFENINTKFDVIVSNPPYIPNDIKLDKSVLDHEPHHALFAKNDGNYFYQKILSQAKEYLNPDGLIILEISNWNLNFIKSYKKVTILKDINGKNRIAIIKAKNL